METPVLTNQDEFPSEEILFSHLGRSKTLWKAMFQSLHEHHPDLSEEWKYYKDGKSWLMKVTRKSKTVFWLSVISKAFRTTFYFTDKAESAILESSISEELKEQFRTGKYYNKIRGLTVTFKNKNDLQFAETLIDLKLKFM
ncbi:MAG: DUF3788 family protein [bacterium]|nr:DUF3788 family protein [bacterium]